MRLKNLFSKRDWLDVRQIILPMTGLDPVFDGYRIAQFSDLHLDGRLTTQARFLELVKRINAQKVDLIVFTGDFVTLRYGFHLADLIPPLRDLSARDGKLAIMGNHDHLYNAGLIQRAIRDSGMINLNNSFHTIQRENASLHIAGVDDLKRHRSRLDLVMKDLPETGPAILLSHEPEFIDISAATERFAVQLSGHTHGGQIRVPLLTSLALAHHTRRYLSGMYPVGGMLLYVNRGIGGVGIPLRINARSELTIMTLFSSPIPRKPPHSRE